MIPLNLRLKALYQNKDANYGKILDFFKNEALVTVLEICLEKGKYKKLNTVKEIKRVDMEVSNAVINLC